jgi:hypothetical protein
VSDVRLNAWHIPRASYPHLEKMVSETLEKREITPATEMNENVPLRIAKIAIDSSSR